MFDLFYPRLVRQRISLARQIKAFLRAGTNRHYLMTGHLGFVSTLAQVNRERAKDFLLDLNNDDQFFSNLENRYQAHLNSPLHPAFFEYDPRSGSVFFQAVTMYLLIRAAQPSLVVETGGASGATAAFTLLALHHNGQGRLYTLDLPPNQVELPSDPVQRTLIETTWWKPGMTSCFLVPDYLTQYHELRLGDAKQTLPQLLGQVKGIDLFRHDSDHRYNHMMFEFETAFAALKPGGILVSDDIANHSAWRDFCSRYQLRSVHSTRHLAGAPKCDRAA